MPSKARWQLVIIGVGILATISLIVPWGSDEDRPQGNPTKPVPVKPDGQRKANARQPRRVVVPLPPAEIARLRQDVFPTAASAGPSSVKPTPARIKAMETLADQEDFDSVDSLIDLMEDEDVAIREAAAKAVYKIAGFEFRQFRANASPEKRAKLVKETRMVWEDMQKHGRVEDYKRRKRANEARRSR